MKDVIVFIESNTTTAELFIESARKEKLEPVIISGEPDRYPFLKKMNVDFLRTDTNELKNIIECVSQIKNKFNVKGIGSSSEYYIETAARAAQYFGLPAADPEAVKNCRDKCVQRNRLFSSGIRVPEFYEIRGESQCKELVDIIKYPVVVKPAFGSGSIGVKMCSNPEEAIKHCRELLKQRTNERGIPLVPKVLMEEFIAGPEFSVETFNGKIIGTTKKYVTDPPHFIETGHDFPCETLSGSEIEDLENTVLSTIKILGLNWGPMHTELKIAAGNSIIIEVNPRLAGGFIPVLIRLAKGIDLIKATVRLWAGRETDLFSNQNEHAAIRFIIPQKAGKFDTIENLNKIQGRDDIYEIKLYKQRGTEIKIKGDFRDRIGHIILHDKNSETVRSKSNDLINQLRTVVN